ncbi:cofactor-independent phosphoglycerate mutase [Marinilabiliaceae bacterium JC017]|nr:cofactor-independent phosphoglycerate mutase [Marinilabiliaceae bacterium JC017]
MKYIVILADGLADEPIEALGNKTPVMVAHTPNIDHLCAMSQTGMVKTVPDSLHPGSEVANMGIMGYDAEKYYQGRGVLEAAALRITMEPGDLVFRCNLVTVEDERLLNHSAGHISTEEAKELIEALNEQLGSERVIFHPGVSYRHVLVVKNGINNIECTPPHDVPGSKIKGIMPHCVGDSETTQLISQLMLASRDVIESHPVNKNRRERGLSMGNMIWPWSPGYFPVMPTLNELYGIKKGGVISAVDLIHGLGRFSGMDSIYVSGATGLYNTNYSGKAEAALEHLKSKEYIYLHVEAPDEAGHEGDVQLKIRTIEDIDAKIVGPILQNAAHDTTIAFLPDHPTPCNLRTHTRNAVPFMIYRPGSKGDAVKQYNEVSVQKGAFGTIKGSDFMKLLLNH